MKIFSRHKHDEMQKEIDCLREQIEEMKKSICEARANASVTAYQDFSTYLSMYRNYKTISASTAIALLAEKMGVVFKIEQEKPEHAILVKKEKA